LIFYLRLGKQPLDFSLNWDLTVVPNLKYQLILAIMDLFIFLKSHLNLSLAVIVGSNRL